MKVGASSGNARFYEFGLSIEDEPSSAVVDVIVSDEHRCVGTPASVGKNLFGMSAATALANKSGALYNIHNFLEEKRLWKARAHSFAFQGSKYFILDSLAESS